MRNIKSEIVSTTKQIGDLADWLIFRHASPDLYKPTIYIDLEGVDLCREGRLSIFTLLIDTGNPTMRVCLIDVHLLGSQAFNTTGFKNKSLKDILQDEQIPKVFFDVRNDSDALFAHFGVALEGVQDIQLMESATRKTTRSRKYLNGLAKCVEKCVLFDLDKASWKLAKEEGERLYKPEHGGSYEVFNQRPIPDKVISYCIGDVQCLPNLWDQFSKNTNRWRNLVDEERKKRVTASQKPEYRPHGHNRELAPWCEDQNRALDEWNYVPGPCELFEEDHGWHFDDNDDGEDGGWHLDDKDDWEDGGWDLNENDNWDDDGPTSCRHIISSCDYEYYYSD